MRDPWRVLVLRLSLALGRSPRELLGSLTSREIAEFAALDSFEPWTGRRADDRHAVLCQVVAGAMTGKTGKASDYVPDYRGALEQQARAHTPGRRTIDTDIQKLRTQLAMAGIGPSK